MLRFQKNGRSNAFEEKIGLRSCKENVIQEAPGGTCANLSHQAWAPTDSSSLQHSSSSLFSCSCCSCCSCCSSSSPSTISACSPQPHKLPHRCLWSSRSASWCGRPLCRTPFLHSLHLTLPPLAHQGNLCHIVPLRALIWGPSFLCEALGHRPHSTELVGGSVRALERIQTGIRKNGTFLTWFFLCHF